MSFTWPLVLAALAALPILVALYIDIDRRRVASQARFGNPDLLPNVVDRAPGRLRYLPPLVLLRRGPSRLFEMARNFVSRATRAQCVPAQRSG